MCKYLGSCRDSGSGRECRKKDNKLNEKQMKFSVDRPGHGRVSAYVNN